MKKYIIIGVVIVVGILFILFLTRSKEPANSPASNTEASSNDTTATKEATKPITNLNDTKKVMNATLHTSEGDIKIEFYNTDAPKTVENFIKLAKSKFYNGVKFHRVIKGFMIQGGDPLSKDDSKMTLWGTGGPGYSFADEIDAKSDLYAKVGYKKGIVAMANSGPNTNGSQFFIMTEDYPLPSLYTIFGKVVSGQDVVDKIALVKTGANDRPVTAVVINSVSVE
jgi:cyclophilin family peptidyl-prolyl cis-trans isomerase